jgi:large subunit ribosomal protein L15
MLTLNTIKAQPGAHRMKKRLGRGKGSGLGKTSGKGHKGQYARSGKGKILSGFEGGQTPLYRRLPKVGFKNIFRKKLAVLNLKDLEFLDNSLLPIISLESLKEAKKIRSISEGLTILGTGTLTKSFTVKANKVTESAQKAITKAGGKVEILERAPKKAKS